MKNITFKEVIGIYYSDFEKDTAKIVFHRAEGWLGKSDEIVEVAVKFPIDIFKEYNIPKAVFNHWADKATAEIFLDVEIPIKESYLGEAEKTLLEAVYNSKNEEKAHQHL